MPVTSRSAATQGVGASTYRSRLARPITVLAAKAVAFVVWVVVGPILSIDLAVQTSADHPIQHVRSGSVALVTLIVGLFAWGLHAILERSASKPAPHPIG